jgi:hypothetical protein
MNCSIVYKARLFTVEYLCALFVEDGVGLDGLFGNWKGDARSTKVYASDVTSC